jgi:hypothetical protein
MTAIADTVFVPNQLDSKEELLICYTSTFIAAQCDLSDNLQTLYLSTHAYELSIYLTLMAIQYVDVIIHDQFWGRETGMIRLPGRCQATLSEAGSSSSS